MHTFSDDAEDVLRYKNDTGERPVLAACIIRDEQLASFVESFSHTFLVVKKKQFDGQQ